MAAAGKKTTKCTRQPRRYSSKESVHASPAGCVAARLLHIAEIQLPHDQTGRKSKPPIHSISRLILFYLTKSLSLSTSTPVTPVTAPVTCVSQTSIKS